MLNPKLGLYAAFLELNAWGALLLFSSRSDAVLLWYLGTHALASLLLALFVTPLLPPGALRPRLPPVLLLAGFSYAVPVFGFIGVACGALLLRFYRLPPPKEPFQSLELPAFDPHQHAPAGFRQAGLRSVLSNVQVPLSSRLGAMASLQYVSGRIASPLLRNVLSDPSEDIRLLAYGLLDNQEKRINRAIDEELRAFQAARASEGGASPGAATLAAAQRLSDLYWELVYQELALGDLRDYAISESKRYCELVLAERPDHGPLTLRRGRLLYAQGDAAGAEAAYRRALELGTPATRVLPYLAELRFRQRRFGEARQLIEELARWGVPTRLGPLVEYWTQA